MHITALTANLLPAAVELVAAETHRRTQLALRAAPCPGDLAELAESWLRPYVEEPARVALALIDDDGLAAILGAIPTRVTPEDDAYTYQSPVHALCPLSGWAARDERAATAHLSALLAELRERLRADGIDRIELQVLDADWWHAGLWRSAGLRPNTVFALRPLAARSPDPGPDDVPVRPAMSQDLDALVDLAMEEHLYHAHHTGSGTGEQQSTETTRRIAAGWLMTNDASGKDSQRAFVAEVDGSVVGVIVVHVLTTPPGPLGSLVLPPRYGYIGLASVAEASCGRGVGRALTDRALTWLRERPDPPVAVGLHYVADNALSAPFWSGRGFAPAMTTLTNAPRHRPVQSSGRTMTG